MLYLLFFFMCTRPYITLNPSAVSAVPYAESVLINGLLLSSDEIRSHPLFAYAFNPSFVPRKSQFFSYCEAHVLSLDCRCYYDSSSPDKSSFLEHWLNNNLVLFPGGRFVNLFIACPCGHCSECCYERKSQIEKRLLLEASDCKDMCFFTLTYDSKSLPVSSSGLPTLVPSHVSDAIKRFRTQVDRYFADNPLKFRVFYVGEYGSSSSRPHYHGLIFFDRLLSYPDLAKLRDIFYFKRNSLFRKDFPRAKNFWPYGYKRDFQVCRNLEASARYCSKYLVKQFFHPGFEGSYPSFYRGPRRNGGLGAHRLLERSSDILQCISGDIPYKFLLGSKVVSIRVPKYIRSKLLPSLSRIAPRISYYFNILLKSYTYIQKFSDIPPFYSKQYSSLLFCCEYLSDSLAFLSLRQLIGSSYHDYKTFCFEIEFMDFHEIFYRLDEACCYLYKYYDSILEYGSSILNILKSYSPFVNRLNLLLSLPQKSELLASDIRYINTHCYVD